MGLNALFELDENDPDRFYLSRRLKHHFEGLLSSFLYIMVLATLFFIWVDVMIREYTVINIIELFIPLSKSDL